MNGHTNCGASRDCEAYMESLTNRANRKEYENNMCTYGCSEGIDGRLMCVSKSFLSSPPLSVTKIGKSKPWNFLEKSEKEN